jgi:hypothetical protein
LFGDRQLRLVRDLLEAERRHQCVDGRKLVDELLGRL